MSSLVFRLDGANWPDNANTLIDARGGGDIYLRKGSEVPAESINLEILWRMLRDGFGSVYDSVTGDRVEVLDGTADAHGGFVLSGNVPAYQDTGDTPEKE